MRLRGILCVLVGLVVLGLPAGASAVGTCPNEALRAEQHATGLPDCRAYELVSPADKGGGGVSVNVTRTRAARELTPGEPMAVQFTALGAFGDTPGTSIGTDYMGVRTGAVGTQGWATHALLPQINEPLTANGGSLGIDPAYVGELSGDLSKGVLRTWSALTEAPEVSDQSNLYLRGDLRTPGGGPSLLLSGCPLCEETATPLGPAIYEGQSPAVVGASSDFGHVIFESSFALTANAPPCNESPLEGVFCPPLLYESDHGTVRLVGVLPSGQAAAESVAGVGSALREFTTRYVPHAISADGSRVFFTSGEGGSLQRAESAPFFGDGPLYMRVDHALTVQVNASERTDCSVEEPRPCTGAPAPEEPAPAEFQEASVDGSRVFFNSNENLTDDATSPGTKKLYMYDTSKPASDPHNLTLLSTEAVAVMGASDDGRYVYFMADGQLVAGAPSGEGNGIYLWHEGIISFVAFVGSTTIETNDNIATGNDAFENRTQARVTPDGQHLLFASNSSVGRRTLYLYSADTGKLQCASCNPGGAPAMAEASDMSMGELRSVELKTSHVSEALSSDGSRVFFNTAAALVPQDVNGMIDAYEFDSASGKVRLLSGGTSPSNSYFLDASPDGDDVFIATTDRLVGWDVDGNYDLYDARVDGGLPEPQAPLTGCLSDACRAQGNSAPDAPSPPSTAIFGAGNIPIPATTVVKAKHNAKAKAKKKQPKRPRRRRKGKRARRSSARPAKPVIRRVGH